VQKDLGKIKKCSHDPTRYRHCSETVLSIRQHRCREGALDSTSDKIMWQKDLGKIKKCSHDTNKY
jgi:hypothetical protein